MKLNEAQKQAVEHKNGPALVLAGPGSGKTFVITNRLKHLIEQHGVYPGNILVVTFTKYAAKEMENRFYHLMGKNPGRLNFGTFHSIFFKVLRYAYGLKVDNILKESERESILQEILKNTELDPEDEKELLQTISLEVSMVKGDGIDINHYHSFACSDEVFKEIYLEYNKEIKAREKIDFDDMVLLTYQLLKSRKDILELWQKKYQYILVDEAQDSNRLQFEIVKMFAGEEKNLFLVGDDDQSLYKFRGARPEILLNFKQIYPEAKILQLKINYRSQGNIIECANRVINQNDTRYKKEIVAFKEKTVPVLVKKFITPQEQFSYIMNEIAQFKIQGKAYNDMAILYRTNIQARMLAENLMRLHIPFKMKDFIPNLYDHWIFKTIETYILLASGYKDRSLFVNIINKPNRYISRNVFINDTVEKEQLLRAFEDKEYVSERIEKLYYDLDCLKNLSPYSGVQYILKAIGLEEYITEYCEKYRVSKEDLQLILGEIQEHAREFSSYDTWFAYITQFKEEWKEQTTNNRKEQEAQQGVSLITFHGSKGLEYDTVYVIDLNEGVTPYHKAVSKEDLEEERRMFYVAMTRAKEHLRLLYLEERFGKKLVVSRFINEMKTSNDIYLEGNILYHRVYGKGQIIKIKEDKITIKFEKKFPAKTLSKKYCIENDLLSEEP